MKILLVEDDHLLATCLSSSLSAQRYVVDVATDGLAGRDFAKAIDYDLIVLDINLPKLDGINLCYQLRKQIYTGPILMLTARANPNDKVLGLDAGADDYVVKPCSIEELCARIRALLRRQKSLDNTLLTWGDLSFNPITCEVRYQGKELLLSPKEYGLLELFLRNPQRIFSSNAILDHLWTFEDSPREETVRSHMKRLRQKLKNSGVEEMIETIYGMGYRLYPPPPTAIMPPCNPTPIALANQARLAALQAWDQLQELMEQRLHILAKASLALQQQSLSVELHHQAIQAAHKMAGSLGMFGLNQASEIGREIERWLQTSELTENISHFQALVSQLQQILQQPIASFPALPR
jgi:DNA-binding response OmpR family regulator/HPt (histidine-containing phosphotransfer) domain-containing protein